MDLAEALPTFANGLHQILWLRDNSYLFIVCIATFLRMDSLMDIQMGEMRKHQAAHVALEANIRNGIRERLIDHLEPTVGVERGYAGHGARLTHLHLIDERIVAVAEGLGDVARLIVVTTGGYLCEVDGVRMPLQ